MLGIQDIQDLLADGFLDGNMAIAGIIMYALALIAIFALSRNIFHTLLISLPVTLVFSMLGVLSSDLMILMIIVTVLGLAYTARNSWRA